MGLPAISGDDGAMTNASDSSVPLSPRIFDLSSRTRLLFSGADRLRYLNGQLTQDLRKLQPDRALPACVTTAKGRLQADVWVTLLDGAGPAIALDAAPELRETLAARLERYIVADDVTLEDCTGRDGLLHCVALDPAAHPELREFHRVSAARLGIDGWDVHVPGARLEAVRTALGGLMGSPADWEKLRVELGVPAWGSELDEDTLPPEAGLERTHIDYHKGCYIGQEVISRLKSVGHVNRTLCQFSGTAPELPSPGERIYNDAGTEAGMLTSVAAEGESFRALGYVKRGQDAPHFKTERGAVVERRGHLQESGPAQKPCVTRPATGPYG